MRLGSVFRDVLTGGLCWTAAQREYLSQLRQKTLRPDAVPALLRPDLLASCGVPSGLIGFDGAAIDRRVGATDKAKRPRTSQHSRKAAHDITVDKATMSVLGEGQDDPTKRPSRPNAGQR
jgi:hypothetical protein